MAKGNALRERRTLVRIESPLLEPLHELGFEPADAQRLLARFETRLVREWIDITLAAKERYGMGYFKRSPAAYLRYKLNLASQGKEGPPEWWYEMRKEAELKQGRRLRKRRAAKGGDSLARQADVSLDEVCQTVFHQLVDAGQSQSEAMKVARLVAGAKTQQR